MTAKWYQWKFIISSKHNPTCLCHLWSKFTIISLSFASEYPRLKTWIRLFQSVVYRSFHNAKCCTCCVSPVYPQRATGASARAVNGTTDNRLCNHHCTKSDLCWIALTSTKLIISIVRSGYICLFTGIYVTPAMCDIGFMCSIRYFYLMIECEKRRAWLKDLLELYVWHKNVIFNWVTGFQVGHCPIARDKLYVALGKWF